MRGKSCGRQLCFQIRFLLSLCFVTGLNVGGLECNAESAPTGVCANTPGRRAGAAANFFSILRIEYISPNFAFKRTARTHALHTTTWNASHERRSHTQANPPPADWRRGGRTQARRRPTFRIRRAACWRHLPTGGRGRDHGGHHFLRTRGSLRRSLCLFAPPGLFDGRAYD